MKKIKLLLLDLAAYLGSLLFLCALILSIFVSGRSHTIIIDLLPIMAVILGIVSLVFTFFYSHKAYHLFFGLLLIIGGTFDFLLIRDYLPGTIFQWWPFLGVVVGIILLVTGTYKYKRIKIGFFVPAISILLFGCWLMLFSFKVIKVSYSVVALISVPLFLILACIFIVTLFLVQQKYKELVVKDDETGVFDDDEIISEKIDE